MGLDYLNKKTWHTASIKNIAKVWEREQKEIRKIQKDDEYKKKLQEEQHAHELKIAQVEAGLIPKSALDKMDWMYNPVMGQQQQNTEQYLLGKPVDMSNLPAGNSLQDPQDNSNKYQAIVSEDVTNSTCENFTLIHEDPLFKIMQEEIKMKEKLMNNPLDMNLIMEEIRKQKQLKKENGESSKKSKKKKDKKSKKEKKNRDKDDRDSKKKKHKSRSRSRSQRKHKKDKDSKKKQHKSDKTKKARSPSSSSESSSRSTSLRSDSRQQKRRSRSRSEKSNNKLRERSISPESKMKQAHYEDFLKKKVGSILVRGDDGTLRPDFGLMKRKFRNNLKPEEKIQMTEEEKKERLKEMQQNAKDIAAERLKEFKDDYKDKDYNNDESQIKELHNKQNNPKFLEGLNKEIYSGQKDLNSLAQQLGKNKTRLARNLEDKNTFKN